MIGQSLRARYELVELLSEGAIFRSFRALDHVLNRDVCIRTFQSPFDKEAPFVEAVKAVVIKQNEAKHPGIERLIEVDDDENGPFLISEASPGALLTERIRKFAPFSVPVAVSTAVSIADALATLHRAGRVHGDLGSHHVMVTPEGGCRLIMGGVWEAYSSSQTAGVVVLPNMAPYLAPEISQGGQPSAASDVYALGVILFQLLSGRLPFIADQPMATILKHSQEEPPGVRSLNPSVPKALEECIKKALSKDPEQRYPDAESFLSDLRMVEDALRFGKSVPWPTGEKPEPREPVVPQLTGIKEESAKGKFFQRRDRDEEEFDEDDVPGDVPMWLRTATIFFVALVVFMIGGWMIFNLNRPRNVTVPNVRGLTLAQAEANLKKLNLKGRIMRREINDQAAGTVVDTDPSPGFAVYEGQSVGLVISQGSRFVETPDVRGLTPDKAREMLDSVGLSLGDPVEKTRDRSAEPGTVVSQVPEPRVRLERGSIVRVKVAGEEDERPTSDAENRRRYLYTIKIELTDIEDPVELRVDMTDSRRTRTIHRETHDPGDEITIEEEGYGPRADFRIFYDGELKKQVTKTAESGAYWEDTGGRNP
ncbi:MAG: PASTA domain-containing protein [Armatimonadetes bacterium]|nr:PASTA domain-containing protein [Armatimonadota bacterium]